MTMKLLRSPDHDQVPLHGSADQLDAVHVFDDRSMLAVNAALTAHRPLLIRGEPGVGKSQLARAAAAGLGRHFVSMTLTIRTELQDLFWRLDAVKRLAEAQLTGAVLHASGLPEAKASREIERRLAVRRFVEPGPLWFAFHRNQALEQSALFHSKQSPAKASEIDGIGTVVLLDEIDKADGSVPNGLLEALGNRKFPGPGEVAEICQMGPPPLVVITTNQERLLPNAFLRRCLVLHLALPTDEAELRNLLIGRGQVHFGAGLPGGVAAPSKGLLGEAADMLIEDRRECGGPPQPGQAEYLDMLRAVCQLAAGDAERSALLTSLRPLTFGKFGAGGPTVGLAPARGG